MNKYLDEINGKFLICYLSSHDGGYRDLYRIKSILVDSSCLSRNSLFSFYQSIFKSLNSFTNILFIHSSPFNIILLIFIKLYTSKKFKFYFLVHNTPKFISRNNLILNFFDKIILKLNLILFNNFVFLTMHVSNSWPKLNNKIILTSKDYALPSNNKKNIFSAEKNPRFFFFGRYLGYKNIELILRVSEIYMNNTFYIYSYNCPYKSFKNVVIDSSWQDNDIIESIYENNDILILPYLEATQSGPLYLGIEHSKLIVLSNIKEFDEFKKYENIIFFDTCNINSFTNALNSAVLKYKNSIKLLNY